MIKNNKWKLAAGSLVILLPLLAGLILWGKLPERMPMHWGIDGQVDGWGSRTTAVLVMPLVLLGLHWLCVLLTAADPLNRRQSGKAVGMVLWICPALSLLMGAVTYCSTFGMTMNVDKLALIFMGLAFVIMGNYLPKCRRNYSIGIKVPWALNDEQNWNATHRFAGRLWVGGGAGILLMAFLPWRELAFVLSFTLLIIMAAASALYYYLYYRKHGQSQ